MEIIEDEASHTEIVGDEQYCSNENSCPHCTIDDDYENE